MYIRNAIQTPIVIIRHIGPHDKFKYMSEQDYKYIKDNLNKPIKLFTLDYAEDGELSALALYIYNGKKSTATTLFIDSDVELELYYKRGNTGTPNYTACSSNK